MKLYVSQPCKKSAAEKENYCLKYNTVSLHQSSVTFDLYI